MSEQAKKLAQALRSLSTGVDAYRAVADAAAELDRLADLCEVLTAERDTARSATASMLRRRDTVANELRCQCQALAAERDAMRAQVTTLAAERYDWAALVGKLRAEVGRQDTILNTQGARISNLTVQRDAAQQQLATLREDRDALAEGVRAYRVSAQGSVDHAVRAWERQHGHRADKKQEPARKADEVKPGTFTFNGQDLSPFAMPTADTITLPSAGTYAITTDGKTAILKVTRPTTVKVEEKPPLLDLRTLPVGTVCEALADMTGTARAPKKGERFAIVQQEPADYAGTLTTRVKVDLMPPGWVDALQPARVISEPRPAPVPQEEPYVPGLPPEALRKVWAEWEDEARDVVTFKDDLYHWTHWHPNTPVKRIHDITWIGIKLRPVGNSRAHVESLAEKETPALAPEPYRAGLPALALRRAHAEWDASDGCTLRFIEANRYEVIGRYQDKIETWGAIDLRPHAATWAEVELNAARLLGSENCNACPCEDCTHRYHMPFLRRELGITDPTRDMTALWAAFREGQRAS